TGAAGEPRQSIEIPQRRVTAVCLDVDGNPDRLFLSLQPEAARHHPDDGVLLVVEREPAAQGIRLRPQPAAPDVVADDHDALAAGPAVAAGEVAPQAWLHAEHRQQAEAHVLPGDALRLGVAGDVERRRRIRLESLEDRRLRLPDGDLLRRETVASAAGHTVGIEDADETIGVGEWRRPQDQLIDDAED